MSQFPFVDKKPRKISSPFGPRIHPITKEKGKLHTGVDMVDKAGTPIVAPEKGLVLESRKSTAVGGGYGYYVKLKGASGTVHIFAHMVENSLAVRKGQRIQQGALLGKMGTTGASTGVHLHWETHVKGKPIDPMTWVKDVEPPKPAPKPVAKPIVTNPSNPPVAKPDQKFHVVQRGDTLNKIAKQYKTSISTLSRINNLENPNLIQVGQKIRLP